MVIAVDSTPSLVIAFEVAVVVGACVAVVEDEWSRADATFEPVTG